MRSATQTAASCWACGGPAAPSEEYAAAGLLSCGACGLLFDPGRSAGELHELYDQSYFEDYSGDRGAYWDDPLARRFEARKRLRWVRRHGGSGRLLEIGCAAGYFLEAARDAGFEVLGVEPEPTAAGRARERTGAEVLVGFVEDVKLPERPFDFAAAWHVLEHIPEPIGAIERIRAALRPGGLLFVEVPNAQGHNARREGLDWQPLELTHHVAHYGPESLRGLLARAGFEVLLTRTYEFAALTPWRRQLNPHTVLHHAVETLRKRTPTLLPHPSRHDLLRAVARRPE